MSKIVDIKAREILDSRGNPTIEADVVLESAAAHPPAPVKRWNCAMVIRPDTWARALPRPLAM